MWPKPPDTRRHATAAQLAEFYARASEEFWDFGSFLFWENPRFRILTWNSLHERVIARLPEAQRVLLALNIVDGQILNGGVEQLFFNYVHDRREIRDAVNLFGWDDLTRRFEQHYCQTFDREGVLSQIVRLNTAFQRATARQEDWRKAWMEFRDVHGAVDGDELNDWFCEEATQQEFYRRVKQYIAERQGDLFVVAD